jgi:Fe2+ transport system protein B
MSLKKTTAPGAALASLDTNQDGLLLREARSQKRKAISPTPQDEELDQEIRDLEAIHQQVERRKEKMLRRAELQKKIVEAAEKMRHITQDNEQGHKPQQRDLVKKALTMMTYGMMTFIMITLLLMMLPPSYRVAGYPMATSIQAS